MKPQKIISIQVARCKAVICRGKTYLASREETGWMRQDSVQSSTRILSVFVAMCFVLLVACVPAAPVPDVLNKTPGPSFTVTDKTYQNATFRVNYPAGWRVQSGEASQPISVIFVAPDEVSFIQLQVGDLNAANFTKSDTRVDVRGIALTNGTEITALFSAPTKTFDVLHATFEQVIASVQAS